MADVIVPIFEADRGWREWARSEVYTGPNGTGKYVPNIDDKIWDWDNGIYRVTAVDESTGLSTWVLYEEPSTSDPTDEGDILAGVGAGAPSESWRVYIDTSVLPYRLSTDAHLYVYGTMVSYAKIFRGTDISAAGEVISKVYDGSGNLVGENIPLELVASATIPKFVGANSNDVINYAIKTPVSAHCTIELSDGELCTLAVYNDAGGFVYRAPLLAMNTAFIRSVEANQRYISSVELLSPFLSKTDPTLIEFPENVTLSSVSMMARVNYSDGQKDIAIDGSKVVLMGMNNFVSTIVGQKQPLVLRYTVGSDESAYANTSVGGAYVTASYTAKTIDVDGAYSVKLYCFPCWDPNMLQYELHWFLYNLNRDTWYSVDSLVELGTNSNAFKPNQYGVQQDMDFVIDLSKVDGRFAKYRHVQHVTITLLAPGNEDRALWTVWYDSTYNHPYGLTQYATLSHISGTNYKCKLNTEHQYQDIWLQRFYTDSFPLFNDALETAAPKPTHFIINAEGVEQEHPISAWNGDFVIPVEIPAGQNIYIHWIRRDGDNDLHLGVSGVRVRYESSGT